MIADEMIEEEILAKYVGARWKTAETYDEQAGCKRLMKEGRLVELEQRRKGFASTLPGTRMPRN